MHSDYQQYSQRNSISNPNLKNLKMNWKRGNEDYIPLESLHLQKEEDWKSERLKTLRNGGIWGLG